MHLEAEKIIDKKNISFCFSFLRDLNNFEHIMPLGKLKKWQSEMDACTFQLDALPEIGLNFIAQDTDSILLQSSGKIPFKFELRITLEELAETQTKIKLFLQSHDINAMLKFMVEKPLLNFLNALLENFSKQPN